MVCTQHGTSEGGHCSQEDEEAFQENAASQKDGNLFLAYFTLHNAIQMRPYGHKWQDFLLFYS